MSMFIRLFLPLLFLFGVSEAGASEHATVIHANRECRHTDGRWEHRVDIDGNLDIAVTTRVDGGHIWLGGSPGRLQMIKLDKVGTVVRTQPLRDNPGVVTATVTLSSDVSAPATTLAFYDKAEQGSLVIPVPNLLAVLLRSHRLSITVPQQHRKSRVYTENVADIPLGTGHRCGADETEPSSPVNTPEKMEEKDD